MPTVLCGPISLGVTEQILSLILSAPRDANLTWSLLMGQHQESFDAMLNSYQSKTWEADNQRTDRNTVQSRLLAACQYALL